MRKAAGKEKVSLQSQLTHRKRTWEAFKERVELEGGAEPLFTPLKRGCKNEKDGEGLMLMNREELKR
jgi:hypothetical protein